MKSEGHICSDFRIRNGERCVFPTKNIGKNLDQYYIIRKSKGMYGKDEYNPQVLSQFTKIQK